MFNITSFDFYFFFINYFYKNNPLIYLNILILSFPFYSTRRFTRNIIDNSINAPNFVTDPARYLT